MTLLCNRNTPPPYDPLEACCVDDDEVCGDCQWWTKPKTGWKCGFCVAWYREQHKTEMPIARFRDRWRAEYAATIKTEETMTYCKGDWSLGTACGQCKKCQDTGVLLPAAEWTCDREPGCESGTCALGWDDRGNCGHTIPVFGPLTPKQETDRPTFAVEGAGLTDRFVLPEQAALIIDVRDEDGEQIVDVKVVFAESTDGGPSATSQMAARLAHVVSAVLRGDIAAPMPSDPTVHPDDVVGHRGLPEWYAWPDGDVPSGIFTAPSGREAARMYVESAYSDDPPADAINVWARKLGEAGGELFVVTADLDSELDRYYYIAQPSEVPG